MSVQSPVQSSWLRSYYFVRALFSIAWIGAAVLAHGQIAVASLLLVIYPAWDAIANLADARANGGLAANRSQMLNVIASSIMTIVVIFAVMTNSYAVLAVFGLWAILSGLLQLYTGVRRWRIAGAQWVMILSGAQSTLAGGFMISRSVADVVPTILDIVPYVGFGAFYFLLSGLWLTAAAWRQAKA
ncbi:DUF308 domain-containing protein [Rhizobium wenxiniae]|uniref:DUF308 domain-containing protein n=1 Tax=Rhizobium wenxiniae TaxID=1737357 RepID=UPI003C1B1ED2